MAAPRRRNLIGQRRQVDDEGDDDGPDTFDHDDESISDGSMTDNNEDTQDSDTSHVDDAHSRVHKAKESSNGTVGPKTQRSPKRKIRVESKPVSDTDAMLHGLAVTEPAAPVSEIHVDEPAAATSRSGSPSTPIVVSSASVRAPSETTGDRRRQEHEEYRKKRDENPAFVPNRGAFFMHDRRHGGPAANGFRPFGRGRGRGGRGGVVGIFPPINQMHRTGDPTTNSPWTHDMHEAVTESTLRRERRTVGNEGPPNGNGVIPTRKSNSTPINRTLSTEKHIGNVQVRVLFSGMQTPIMKSGVPVKQYTKLPDHRPPLRRDKPVRISLPDRTPRYVYPATDRSFIFIPRAMRPNTQQRMRGGKSRSGLGSVGGFSRRTSIFGGSYYGSMYSPSIMSRRSSIGQDRDFALPPTDSAVPRPPMPAECPRPVVRLPPAPRPEVASANEAAVDVLARQLEQVNNYVAQPQAASTPKEPPLQENHPVSIPMHQPRPQKNISVVDIDTPNLAQSPQAFQQAFHQQMPVQVANGFVRDSHARQSSYISQRSTGTPLSQIPERAIHAAPFQPIASGQVTQPHAHYYPHQGYPPQPQQPYYYPQGYGNHGMSATYLLPQQQQLQQPLGPYEPQAAANTPQESGQGPPTNSNLVAQEVNGMVYYYDASQMPPVHSYQPTYSTAQPYQPSVLGMGGMVTPSPDGYYYPQTGPNMVYYPQ